MFHFFAYLSRMKLIDRWSLMRCVQKENVQEHSLQVAILAHALAVIGQRHFGRQVSPERVATLALFHDATEVITGDLPTPVKYFNGEIRAAYSALEDHAARELLKLLPQELRPEYEPLLSASRPSDHEARALVKAADSLAALIKCLEERAAGNGEFLAAEKTIRAKVQEQARRWPEVDYFVRTFIPSYSLTLDEISAREYSSPPGQTPNLAP